MGFMGGKPQWYWRFKNTALLLASLAALFYIVDTDLGREAVSAVASLGYQGSVIAGVLFVSTFTVAPAAVLLFSLAHLYDPYLVAITAGAGAVVGDYLIFRFLRDRVFDEIRPVFMKLGGTSLSRLMSTPYFAWLAPALGALIIASPLPDEVGIGLMGISKLKNWQFLLLSFFLNSAGILIIVTLAEIV